MNLTITGLGAIVGIINARILGPEALGVIGVVLGVYAGVSNFLDIRLADIVAKLYYQRSESIYRSTILRGYLFLSLLIGAAIWLTGFFLVSRVGNLFTNVPIKPEWVIYSSFYFALNYWNSSIQYQQRFSERFYLIGAVRFAAYIAWAGVFLSILVQAPNVGGYFLASFWGAILNFLITFVLSVFIWVRYEKFDMFTFDFGGVFYEYFCQVRMLFWGNILGYTKLLHRGVDILFVGYFADDRITGVYKLARSLADATFVFYDSMNQVYFPRFMQLLADSRFKEFQVLARHATMAAAGITLTVLAVEWLGLRYFLQWVLTDKFTGAEPVIIILSATLFFIMGPYMWMWPVFVTTGRLGQFTGYSVVAGLAQYGIAYTLFRVLGADPAWAAIGYLGYYLVLIPAMWFLMRAYKPEVLQGFWR